MPGKIARITTGGNITEFPLPEGTPLAITAGPDGALWFTDQEYSTGSTVNGIGKIGRITTGGSISLYTIPLTYLSSYPNDIIAGPDGALWFTESEGSNTGAGKIGRITTGGSISLYAIPYVDVHTQNHPNRITAGPDGALWFTESAGTINGDGMISRITTTGNFTQYPLPTSDTPNGIIAGSDGALWFTDLVANSGGEIGRITTTGSITKYQVPTPNSQLPGSPTDITAGSDGALWFTEQEYSGSTVYGVGRIGRITTTGSFTDYPIPTAAGGSITVYGSPYANFYPFGITAGPDGALWFAEYNGLKIGRVGLQ
jgi:virginiamycin B lyase